MNVKNCGGLLKRYIERLNTLENITLADWVAWYDNLNVKSCHKKSKQTDIDDLPPETSDNDDNNDDDLCNDTDTKDNFKFKIE